MLTLRDYYLQQYPDGVREERMNPSSLTYALDTARFTAISEVEMNIKNMGRQFQVLTADIALDDYEEFLKIPKDTSLTISERRVRILIKFAGYPATVRNIKDIAREITGVNIVIREHGIPGDPNYDTSHPWKVTIIVDFNDPNIKTFSTEYFEEIMKQVFPNHTEWESDSFVYIPPLSYLAPADPDKKEFVLNEDYLQINHT